jgi:hypothetical protein
MKFRLLDGRVLGGLAAVVAVAAVATSIWLNPPSAIRAREVDQRRLQNLDQTVSAINTYFNVHHALPPELKALEGDDNRLPQISWHDPETKRPYDYEITGETTYRLCAVFARASEEGDNPYYLSEAKHKAGRDCFQKTAPPPAKP